MSEKQNKFVLAGPDYKDGTASLEQEVPKKQEWWKGKPVISVIVLGLILTGCIFADFLMTHSPTYMDLQNYSIAPNKEFLFGTDALGRDIFSMVWYGGRISLFIGVAGTVISTVIAIVYGTISGMAAPFVDEIMMRFTEILLSVPGILLVVFLQGIVGQSSVVTIAWMIGVTSWMNVAKIIRTEVRQIYKSDYVTASRCFGGGFFHVLKKHLIPNFFSAIMFMVVMNVRSAMVQEATLSFLGIGLPIEIISWGSMLSLSERALMTNAWWLILIPGAFMVGTLMCITNIGNYIRIKMSAGI